VIARGLISTLAIAAGLAAMSPPAGATSAPRVVRGIPYRVVDGTTLRMDVWSPGGRRRVRPALLLVHGGSWRGGARRDMDPEGRAAARAGIVAVSVGYRLHARAPAIPRQLADVRAAIGYIRAHAARLGVDPARIGALGISAGANLAALLATTGTGRLDSGDRVRALVSWSGPMDLVALARETAPAPGCRGERDCSAMASLARLLTSSVMTAPPEAGLHQYLAASPLYHVSADDPPTLLVNSTAEWMPMSQSLGMTATLRASGVPAWFVRLPGSNHGGYGARAWPRTLRFLKRWLIDPAPSRAGGHVEAGHAARSIAVAAPHCPQRTEAC